jgi:hypothetical protein
VRYARAAVVLASRGRACAHRIGTGAGRAWQWIPLPQTPRSWVNGTPGCFTRSFSFLRDCASICTSQIRSGFFVCFWCLLLGVVRAGTGFGCGSGTATARSSASGSYCPAQPSIMCIAHQLGIKCKFAPFRFGRGVSAPSPFS